MCYDRKPTKPEVRIPRGLPPRKSHQSGSTSALATHRLQEMGLQRVAHLGGGMNAWKAANGPVAAASVSCPVDG